MLFNLLPTRDGGYREHLKQAEPKESITSWLPSQVFGRRLQAVGVLALLFLFTLLFPNAFLAWLIVNVAPGLGILLLLPELRRGPLGSEAIVHSYFAAPVLLYFLRIADLGNSLLAPVILILPLACACIFSRSCFSSKFAEESRSKEATVDFWLVGILMLAAAFPVAVALLPLILGNSVVNNMGDLPKHAAAVFGVLNSSGLVIDNPFVPNAKMVYYFFYYFKIGAFSKLAGLQSPTGVQVSLFIESLISLYVFLYLLVRTARTLGATTLVICVAVSLFVLDGGWDVFLSYLSAMPLAQWGHPENFVRIFFGLLGVTTTAYVGFVTKLLWVPQHVGAMAAFLYCIRLLTPVCCLQPENADQRRSFGFAAAIALALALVSSLGLSVLISFAAYLAIGAVVLSACVHWILHKDWRSLGWLAFCAILSAVLVLPLVSSYSGKSSMLSLRPFDELSTKFNYDSTITVLAPLTEYGSLSLLIGAGLLLAIYRRTITSRQLLLLLSYGGLLLVLLSLRTDAVINDLGMHVYSVMGVVALLLVFTFDLNSLLTNRVFTTLLFVTAAPGVWANFNELRFHVEPGTVVAQTMWDAGRYVYEHAEKGERATCFATAWEITPILASCNDITPMITGIGSCPPSGAASIYLTPQERAELMRWLQELYYYRSHPTVDDRPIKWLIPKDMSDELDNSRISAGSEEEDLKQIMDIYATAGVRWVMCHDNSPAYKSLEKFGQAAGLELRYENRDWRVYRLGPSVTQAVEAVTNWDRQQTGTSVN